MNCDDSPFTPLTEELTSDLDVETAFRRLAVLPHCVFLDSALREPELGRYSFLSADPFEFWHSGPTDAAGLQRLQQRLTRFTSDRLPELPPFQGGAAGLFSYDLGRAFERLPRPTWDEFRLPGLAVGLYDIVLAFDHQTDRTVLISQGFPETDIRTRRARAERRIRQFLGYLNNPARTDTVPQASCPPRSRLRLAPQFPLAGSLPLTSDFSEPNYLSAVDRAIEYIHAGDVFQVNLSQRLLHPAVDDSVSLYVRLRHCNPATFAGYFDLGDFQVVSASPERFVRVEQQLVEARPIKGTRQRTAHPEADLYAGDDLLQSEKDRAENVMIVDLLRNDLSRVCDPGSVRVTQLCQLEVYQFVQHLVSVVRGKLEAGCNSMDVIRAAFPGGSITGAPKVRAMEIIAEIEPTARGAYCGSLGYLGFDGGMDLSILIRTITAGRGWWQLPVGGGIVAQSDPRSEYQETWHKATGLLRALRPA